MKQELRCIALSKRREIPSYEREKYSKVISQKLITFLVDRCLQDCCIALYMPMYDEVDVSYIFSSLSNICVPRIINDTQLEFTRVSDDSFLNRYQILEYEGDAVEIENIDVFIVPLVAFDKQKYRLGMGKGYYDRVLAQSNAIKIGVGFCAQEYECVFPQNHDIQLDYIICENRIL